MRRRPLALITAPQLPDLAFASIDALRRFVNEMPDDIEAFAEGVPTLYLTAEDAAQLLGKAA